jgi:hypothetical protein
MLAFWGAAPFRPHPPLVAGIRQKYWFAA